jgi:hypothetical protein
MNLIQRQNYLGEIEWLSYPVAEKDLTQEEAVIAMATEKQTFGSCVSQITPDGERRVLIGGKWHRVRSEL